MKRVGALRNVEELPEGDKLAVGAKELGTGTTAGNASLSTSDADGDVRTTRLPRLSCFPGAG